MRRVEAAAASAPRLGASAEAQPLLLTGQSPAARQLAEEIDAAARSSRVLIECEAGLDAGEIARLVHARSGRRGSLEVVDCGAADPAAVERELFGVVAARAGDLESIGARSALAHARGGTLFLADLLELPAAAQARLARVARDGEARIGGETIALDVAVIAAASGVEDAVGEGRLRRDLHRQLARRRVVVPELRRRAEDLPLMIDALVGELCAAAAMPCKTLTQAARTLLAAMPWRGNLVELRHAVSRLVAAAAAETIQLEDVLAHVRFDGALLPHAPAGTLRSARQQFEREYIVLVLRHHRGHVGQAARALGIQRTNLYRKARQLGISVVRTVA